jgi:hypothetical protein
MIFLAGCGGPGIPTVGEEGAAAPPLLRGAAPVESIVTEIGDTVVSIVAGGFLPDHCTRIDTVTHQIRGDSILIQITTRRPVGQPCPQGLQLYKRRIELPRQRLRNGVNMVVVNAAWERFVLPPSPLGSEARRGPSQGIDRAYIYLVTPEQHAPGSTRCADRLVPVEIAIDPLAMPLAEVLRTLMAPTDTIAGARYLHNALGASALKLEYAALYRGRAIISLVGTLQLTSSCDGIHVLGQLRQCALQFTNVNSVSVEVNGVALEQLLQQGAGQK